jgi:hypothetical protein
MKQRILSRLRGASRKVLNRVEKDYGVTFFRNDGGVQKLLMAQYRLLAGHGKVALPGFNDVGFRTFSQFEEDGILLYIFSLIPPINKQCVELCAGNGRENMTSNLIVNHGWWGHLFDGNPHSVEAGKMFFANNKDTFFAPPRFTHAWITAENVNDLIATSGAKGPIDLLSLDMDGVDYWIWRAIDVVQPRVVVCETANSIPATHALTVPYAADFSAASEDFRSASLAAMCKLGREKGYRLVGTHRFGFNAFFIQNGLAEDFFPEVTPASCLQDPVSQELQRVVWPKIQNLGWVTV